jgi:Secretion system C-terminal sorting domain
MKKILIIFFILLFSNGSFSQPTVRFKRLYDLPPHFASESQGIAPTDFGYIISGITIDTAGGISYNQLTIMAVDTLGDSLWVKNYGNPNFQYAHDYSPKWMIKKGNNLFLACPVLKPGSIWSSVLLKFNMSGDTVWQKEYTSIDPYLIVDGINSTPDLGFILTGWTYDGTNQSLLLLKTDSLGNELWRKKLNATSLSIHGKRVVFDPTTNKYIIVGSYYPSATSESESLVIITDSLGNKLSQFSYNSINGGSLENIIQSSDNNFIACGKDYTGLMIGSWPKMRAQIVKFDINGTLIWSKKYGVPSIINYFNSVIQLSNNELVFAGQYDTIYNYGLGLDTDFIIQKTTALGDSIWAKQISIQGMNYQDNFTDMDIANDGGYVLTGFFPVGPSPQKYCLVKLDSFGCEIAGCQLVGITEPTPLDIAFEIYPNPTANQLTLEFQLTTITNTSIEIKNTLGQTMKTIDTKNLVIGKNTMNININEFAAGIYFLQLKAGNTLYTKKIIKE